MRVKGGRTISKNGVELFFADCSNHGLIRWWNKLEMLWSRIKRKGRDPDLRTQKRKKKDSEILQRYPIQCNTDVVEGGETTEEHKRAMVSELSKAKPRESVLLPLMKSTFGVRRMLVLSDDASVSSILEEYPALNRPVMVRLFTYVYVCVIFIFTDWTWNETYF